MKKFKKALATGLAVVSATATLCMPLGAGAESTYTVDNAYISTGSQGISTLGFSQTLANTIDGWANSLYNSSGFGDSISYSSSWYSSLSTVEILSRLIYAEATTNSDYFFNEQVAVTWVLINRVNSSLFDNSLRNVATETNPVQFSSITGSSSSTQNARKPDKTSSAWKNAVWLSCAILSTSDSSDYMWLFGKPLGIDNQLFFYSSSLATFSTNSGILTINGIKVTDAAYAGVGAVVTPLAATNQRSVYKNIYYNYY